MCKYFSFLFLSKRTIEKKVINVVYRENLQWRVSRSLSCYVWYLSHRIYSIIILIIMEVCYRSCVFLYSSFYEVLHALFVLRQKLYGIQSMELIKLKSKYVYCYETSYCLNKYFTKFVSDLRLICEQVGDCAVQQMRFKYVLTSTWNEVKRSNRIERSKFTVY